MWNIFEQPWTLLGAAVLVLFGVLTFRSVWSEKRKPWQWLLPAGVALLGVGLDLAVTTDFRDLFGEILARHLGATDLSAVFPGHPLTGANFLGAIRG